MLRSDTVSSKFNVSICIKLQVSEHPSYDIWFPCYWSDLQPVSLESSDRLAQYKVDTYSYYYELHCWSFVWNRCRWRFHFDSCLASRQSREPCPVPREEFLALASKQLLSILKKLVFTAYNRLIHQS